MQLKTKYYFDNKPLSNLSKEIKNVYAENVLLLYGNGSIKRNGIYNEVKKEIAKANVNLFEFSGIHPNPKVDEIYEAARYAENNQIDLIVAVGGGSVIDAAKVIATLATNPHFDNTWDYIMKKYEIEYLPLPIFSVITLAGTASENNWGSVVTNDKIHIKKGIALESSTPQVAFIDPEFTKTVSKWQTASGIFDCFSHCLEQYYGRDSFEWTTKYLIMNMKNILEYGQRLIINPSDEEARQNVSWTTTMSLNQLSNFNLKETDWNVHTLEHALSGIYDVTHGAGLALITPTYIKIRCQKDEWFKQKTERLARELFNLKTADDFLKQLDNFISVLGLPKKSSDFKEIKELDVDALMKHSSITEHNDPNYLQKVELFKEIWSSIPK